MAEGRERERGKRQGVKLIKDAPSQTFLYFAYGSNMLTSRLKARCPSARVIGPATAPGHRLAFSKRSQDGSGKATLAPSGAGAQAMSGVMFEIANGDMPALDKAEERGVGYDRLDEFSVRCMTRDKVIPHTTYIACMPVVGLTPYDWYLALVVAGAREHDLDKAHIREILNTPRKPDPDPERPSRRAAIAALNEAGYADEIDALSRDY